MDSCRDHIDDSIVVDVRTREKLDKDNNKGMRTALCWWDRVRSCDGGGLNPRVNERTGLLVTLGELISQLVEVGGRGQPKWIWVGSAYG